MRRILIYLITNMVNGKRYVGQTCKTLNERWAGHVWNATNGGGCPLFGKAIAKYGAGAFKRSVLMTCTSRSKANSLERALIAQLKCIGPLGYNIRPGGSLSIGGMTREIALRREAKKPKALRGAALKRWRAQATPEDLTEATRRRKESWLANRTPKQRSAVAKLAYANMSPASRRAMVAKASRTRRKNHPRRPRSEYSNDPTAVVTCVGYRGDCRSGWSTVTRLLSTLRVRSDGVWRCKSCGTRKRSADPDWLRRNRAAMRRIADDPKWRAKMRAIIPRGARHPLAKLTAVDVRRIRAKCRRGETQRSVAAEFRITQGNVGAIVLRRSWKHIR